MMAGHLADLKVVDSVASRVGKMAALWGDSRVASKEVMKAG